MPIPINIETLLRGRAVESPRIEYKTAWDPESSLKTICAFANDIDNWGGGYVVIGVEERDGAPLLPVRGVPIDKIDAWQKDILNKIRLIRPFYTPVMDVVDYGGKKLIVIWVPGGLNRPYSSPTHMGKDADRDRSYFVRFGSSTVIAKDELLQKLFRLSESIPFDDQVNHAAKLSDLNGALIKSYLDEVGSSLAGNADSMNALELGRSLQIVSELSEYEKPRNVGLLFFNMNPERFFPYAQIEVVNFLEENGDRLQEKIFRGPLHQQLREALLHIRNMYIAERVVKRAGVPEADRFFNYPFAAVEEALANAVFHKGYDVREPIEVRIEPDNISIVSHPGAEAHVTLEALRDENKRPIGRAYRNRRVGEFLKELHLTEGRNTGIQKIRNAMRNNGSPPPEFDTDDDRSYFVTTLPIHPEFLARDVRPEENAADAPLRGEDQGRADLVREAAEVLILVADYMDSRTAMEVPEEERARFSKVRKEVERVKNLVEGAGDRPAGAGAGRHPAKNIVVEKERPRSDKEETAKGSGGRRAESAERTEEERSGAIAIPDGLSGSEERIWKYAYAHPRATIAEVSGAVGLSLSSVKRGIRSLTEKGVIVREGSTRDRRWVFLNP